MALDRGGRPEPKTRQEVLQKPHRVTRAREPPLPIEAGEHAVHQADRIAAWCDGIGKTSCLGDVLAVVQAGMRAIDRFLGGEEIQNVVVFEGRGPKADFQRWSFVCRLGGIGLGRARLVAAPGNDVAEVEQHGILDVAGDVAFVVARLEGEHDVAPAAALVFGRQPARYVDTRPERHWLRERDIALGVDTALPGKALPHHPGMLAAEQTRLGPAGVWQESILGKTECRETAAVVVCWNSVRDGSDRLADRSGVVDQRLHAHADAPPSSRKATPVTIPISAFRRIQYLDLVRRSTG